MRFSTKSLSKVAGGLLMNRQLEANTSMPDRSPHRGHTEFALRRQFFPALREMKCAPQDEANETGRDLHGRT
jgi:hypothetical protein